MLKATGIFTKNTPPRRRRTGGAGRAIRALMLREMATTFGRSPGGYLWAIAEPVAAILLLSFAFSLALHRPALGSSFILFYASGYLPFTMVIDCANRVANALRFSRPLLLYPAVQFTDALAARFLLGFGTQLAITVMVLTGIAAGLSVRLAPDPVMLLLAIEMAAVLSLGLGVMNCLLFGLWPLWERLWQVATRPLFLVSGVFFLPERIPDPWGGLLALNPITHVVGAMREGLYPGYHGATIWPAFLHALGLGLLALALALLRRLHPRLLEG